MDREKTIFKKQFKNKVFKIGVRRTTKKEKIEFIVGAVIIGIIVYFVLK